MKRKSIENLQILFFRYSRAIQASLALYQESGILVGEYEDDEAEGRERRRNDTRNENLEFVDEDNEGRRCNNENNERDLIDDTAEQLRIALRLSEQQQIEEEQRRLLEEETFRQVLELSLTEK